MRWMIGVAVSSSLVAGCGPDPARAKLSSLQQEVFTPSCALSSCHGSSSPVAGLDLREGKTRASLVDIDSSVQPGTKRVAPGDAENSTLYQAITGTGTDVPRMPPGSKLSDDELAAIKLWIDNGALDD